MNGRETTKAQLAKSNTEYVHNTREDFYGKRFRMSYMNSCKAFHQQPPPRPLKELPILN